MAWFHEEYVSDKALDISSIFRADIRYQRNRIEGRHDIWSDSFLPGWNQVLWYLLADIKKRIETGQISDIRNRTSWFLTDIRMGRYQGIVETVWGWYLISAHAPGRLERPLISPTDIRYQMADIRYQAISAQKWSIFDSRRYQIDFASDIWYLLADIRYQNWYLLADINLVSDVTTHAIHD